MVQYRPVLLEMTLPVLSSQVSLVAQDTLV
jgi:hypothetical protein